MGIFLTVSAIALHSSRGSKFVSVLRQSSSDVTRGLRMDADGHFSNANGRRRYGPNTASSCQLTRPPATLWTRGNLTPGQREDGSPSVFAGRSDGIRHLRNLRRYQVLRFFSPGRLRTCRFASITILQQQGPGYSPIFFCV